MGVCFMFYLGIATATSVRVAGAIGRGNQEEVKNAGRLGVAATMVMGVILGVLLVSLAGPISRLLVREDAIIGGHRDCAGHCGAALAGGGGRRV